jgi:nucleoside-diphosphate-sugar epimerase
MRREALVTGGAGFIGSHLVERLLREGWRVRVLDNFSTGSGANLESAQRDLEVIEGDIRDAARVRQACAGVDTVFHLAALVSVVGSVADPLASHSVNVNGTLSLLVAARDAGVRRLVFSSSTAVYGDAQHVPTGEETPIAPQSPYGSDKAACELYCRNFHDLYGLETVALRYFNVFGPRQNACSGYAAAIPAFVQATLEGRRPVIFGDGLQTRDFVYVENVVQANVLAANAPAAGGGAFNVASGVSVSLLDLLGVLSRVAGRQLDPVFHEARTGEVRHSRADITRAASVLGYEPAFSLADGLALTVEAYRRAEGSSAVPATA